MYVKNIIQNLINQTKIENQSESIKMSEKINLLSAEINLKNKENNRLEVKKIVKIKGNKRVYQNAVCGKIQPN